MTDRIVRHIALFSLLVFAYPIAFMTFHVLHDHLPGDSCVHTCCSHTNHHNSQKKSGDAGQTQLSENSHCLICEYELAKTDGSPTETFLQADNYACNLCEDICRQSYLAFSGTNKSLRAPPLII
jgi:hypothetical protein